MPGYLCRWPNGDCSAVSARDEQDAILKLDEVSNAEGCPLVQLREFQIHFHLTDDGELELENFGEETEAAIWKFCYPLLEEATSEQRREAVLQERRRVVAIPVDEPETELGRDIKKQMGAPTALVDEMIRQEGEDVLKNLKRPRKPH